MLKMAKLKYNFSILKNYVHELSDLVSSSKSSCKEKCQLFLQFTWKVFKIAKKNSIDFVSFGKSNACHWDQGKANVSMYFYIITAEILISKISWRTLGYIQLHLKIKILRNWYGNKIWISSRTMMISPLECSKYLLTLLSNLFPYYLVTILGLFFI